MNIKRYREIFGKMPNVIRPKTFNEKMQRRILFDRNPRLVVFSDKLQARGFVQSRMGNDELLPTLYAIVDSPAEISHLNLPLKFVMKSNHGSGMVEIFKDSSAIPPGELEALASEWLRRNFFDSTQEWAYKNIRSRIMFEELLEADGEVPDDYKLFCFDGEPRFLYVAKDRLVKLKTNFYDLNMNQLPVSVEVEGHVVDNFPEKIEAPPNFDRMLAIARRLSEGIDFVRVDLYNLGGRIRFGELSVYCANGLMKCNPPEWDLKFGSYWK